MDQYDVNDTAWPDGFYRSRDTSDITVTADGLKDRVRDFVFLLDELTKWNRDDARFAGRLGLDQVGAMGMSWGGPTVAELAQQDADVKPSFCWTPAAQQGMCRVFRGHL